MIDHVSACCAAAVPAPLAAALGGGGAAAMHLVKKRRHASAMARRSLGSVRAHAMTSAASACVAVRRFMALRYAGVSAAGGSPTAGRGSGRYDSRAPSSSHQRMLYAQ